MSRVAFFIDSMNARKAPLALAQDVAMHLDGYLDVHHPWANQKNLSGRPGARPIMPEKVESSGRGAARNLYHETCGENPISRFIGVDGHLVDAIRSFGIGYDLIVLDRLSEEVGRQTYAFNTALFDSGSPLLVMPPNIEQASWDRIVIVWSGTCQSGRAMRAGLPFLKKAKEVIILSNTANPMANPSVATEYLRAADIDCSIEFVDGSGPTARGRGRALIRAGVNLEADMMIMGAFGYNGLERLLDLGRATRKLVTATPIPLLLQS